MKIPGSWFFAFLFIYSAGAWAQGPLRAVLDESVLAARQGQVPVAVLDLDDTVFDSRFRTLGTLQRAAADPELVAAYPSETRALQALKASDVRYLLSDTLAAIGITRPELVRLLEQRWRNEYFSNLCAGDPEIPGAGDFVRALLDSGARVVFLTGRDEPRMKVGTVEDLQNKGMLRGDMTVLLMKPDKSIADLDFKRQAVERIRSMGMVVALFENEPRNLNRLHQEFPQASALLLNTFHSNAPDLPAPGTIFLRDFGPGYW